MDFPGTDIAGYIYWVAAAAWLTFGLLLYLSLIFIWVNTSKTRRNIKRLQDHFADMIRILNKNVIETNKSIKLVAEKLDNLTVLTDPDGSRKKQSLEHAKERKKIQAEERLKRRQLEREEEERRKKELAEEAERIQKEEEARRIQEKSAKKAKKAEIQLKRKSISIDCPNCGKQILVSDLRPHIEHTCPNCDGSFAFE